MDLFRSAGSTLDGLFSSSRSQATSSKGPPPLAFPPPILFPQFARLPVELRLKIWAYAADSRILFVHFHLLQPAWIPHELRYQGYASDNHGSQSSFSKPFDGPKYVPETEEEGGHVYPRTFWSEDHRPHHLVVTPCTSTRPCKCSNHPPQSFSAVPLPAVFLVSHESRDAAKAMYSIRLDGEYDTRGLAVVNPVSKIYQATASKPPITGLLLNPSVDTIAFRCNIARRGSVEEVHHFAAIVAQQVPDVPKVIVELNIGMFRSARSRLWRNWGQDGWWIPTRFLVQMWGLREVVFLVKVKDKLLPDEWRTRTEALWIRELLKVEDKWPPEWMGKFPSLKFQK